MALDLDKFAAKTKKERRELDLELWKQWDQGGRRPEDMRPLIQNFRGMIRSHANQYANNVEIPPAAINAEFTKHFAKAVQTYDPNRGALGTWVGSNLVKGRRWISQRQNTVRISEGRVYSVGDFLGAKSHLDQKFGRPPNTQEVAEHLGWSPKKVARLEKEVRADLIGSAMTVDPMEIMPSKEKEVLALLPYDLSDREKTVYEYTLGTNGKPKLNGNQLAAKMGVSPSTVSRLKSSIALKAKKMIV